jgi:2-dehydropantoate 2-reductase
MLGATQKPITMAAATSSANITMTRTLPSLPESIHILGAGSIGMLFAATIRQKYPKYPVTLLLRNVHRPKYHEDHGKDGTMMMNVLLKHPDSNYGSTIPVPLSFIGDDSASPIHNLIVTTKSYQALQAVESVLPYGSVQRIILLCNGALSVKVELEDYLINQPATTLGTAQQPKLILATTTHGAYRQEIDENNSDISIQTVTHAGFGKTFIENSLGGINIGNLWNDVGLNCNILSSQQMQELLWKKLAANCVINPLTAIFRCTNGELLSEPSFPILQQEILDEVASVVERTIERNGNNLDRKFTIENPFVMELRNFVVQVIEETRLNKSSMYQDILSKRQTEIDHLNGYIVRKGREVGVECPTNEDIYHRIKQLNS